MDFRGQKNSVVTKLRVRGEGIDNVSARLSLERLFAATDFAPSSLPSAAIVCIKKIVDPRPRSLRLNQTGLRFADSWRAAVAREIETLYRRAFRPVSETVPASAESVIFADRAELLACLASDWRRGILAENWWWRALFPKLGEAQTVAKIWLESAEYIAPAFEILAKKGEAVSFIQSLQSHEIKAFTRKVVQIYGLQKLEAALFEPVAKKSRTEDFGDSEKPERRRFKTNSKTADLQKNELQIRTLLPEINTAQLNFEAQILLETVLLLARSPKTARSAEFARRAGILRAQSEFGEKAENFVTENLFAEIQSLEKSLNDSEKKRKKTTREGIISTESRKKKAKTPNEIEQRKTSEVIENSGLEKKSQPQLREQKQTESQEKAAKKIEFYEADPITSRIEKSVPKLEKKAKSKGAETTNRVEKNDFERFFAENETPIEYSFQTKFGGIFYLLNLGLYLELYRDFTESLAAEIDLGIWDFVALLGLEFLGERIKSDPLWEFLKFAAERESDADFGREFDNSQDWRAPAAWLKAFPKNQKWLFGQKGKRLIIRHAGGFNVADVLRRGDFERQLKAEVENYKNYYREIIRAEKKEIRSLRSKKWLENLAEYLQKRLFQAVNAQNADELNALLFERGATVSMTATHLEITFSLADLPFEVRLAGIDRDPGWIPAAGRFVYFHYV